MDLPFSNFQDFKSALISFLCSFLFCISSSTNMSMSRKNPSLKMIPGHWDSNLENKWTQTSKSTVSEILHCQAMFTIHVGAMLVGSYGLKVMLLVMIWISHSITLGVTKLRKSRFMCSKAQHGFWLLCKGAFVCLFVFHFCCTLNQMNWLLLLSDFKNNISVRDIDLLYRFLLISFLIFQFLLVSSLKNLIFTCCLCH